MVYFDIYTYIHIYMYIIYNIYIYIYNIIYMFIFGLWAVLCMLEADLERGLEAPLGPTQVAQREVALAH